MKAIRRIYFFKMKQEINLIEIGVLTGIEIDSMMNKMSS
jgi:hypothetical protein